MSTVGKKRGVWKSSEGVLGGFPAITYSQAQAASPMPYEAPELSLSGVYGDIWQYSPSQYRAIITSPRIARRYLPPEKHPVNPDDEILIRFPPEELALWVKRLRVSRRRPTQAKLANSFGKE